MFSTEDWRAAGAAQLDDAARVLGSVFGTVPGKAPVIDRRPWPLEGTFDAEVVTCRTATGDIRQVYCKHGPDIDLTDPHAAYGQRGGLGREAAVYTYVLEPLGVNAPRCIAFRRDEMTDADWLVLEFLDGARPLHESRRSRSLDRAAEWLGSFHGATEGLWPDLLLSGIPFRDADWYQGWMDRTAAWAGALHLRYPWLAARRGLQGVVELEVRLSTEGRLAGVDVVGGAAAGLLREAALRAVRDAMPFPLPAGVDGRPLTIRLPVVFELR